MPYDPGVLLLGIYPRELKTYVHTKLCTWMFKAVLFPIAPERKLKCPARM